MITELAEKAGVAASTISRIERGVNKNLRAMTLIKISRVLQVDYTTLALNARKTAR